MSDSMQIESLWKFNAKYDPDWQPRYAVYDSPEHALPAAVAVARAESFWELPVIGRFLVPDDKLPDKPLVTTAPAGPADRSAPVGDGAAGGDDAGDRPPVPAPAVAHRRP